MPARAPGLRSVLPVSLPPEAGQLIARAARKAKAKSLSGFIRDAAVEKANRVLAGEDEPDEQEAEAASVAA